MELAPTAEGLKAKISIFGKLNNPVSPYMARQLLMISGIMMRNPVSPI
jgi:hypothetical protein